MSETYLTDADLQAAHDAYDDAEDDAYEATYAYPAYPYRRISPFKQPKRSHWSPAGPFIYPGSARMKLLHATPFTSMYSILQHGLVAEPDHPVHLSIHDRRDFIATLHLVPLEDVALLAVDVTGLELEPGWDGDGSFAYAGTISPDRVKVIG